MANGIFLGGVAEGMESAERQRTQQAELGLRREGLGLKREGLGLRERALNIQERGLQQEADMAQQERIDTTLSDSLTKISEVNTALAEAGVPLEDRKKRLMPVIQDHLQTVQAAGRDATRAARNIGVTLQSAVTPQEQAQTEAQAEVAGARETADAAGVSEQQAVRSATGMEPKNIQLRTFQVPGENSPVSVRADDAEGINSVLAKGGVETPQSVQAQDVSGLQAAKETTPGDIQEARGEVRDLTANIEELEETARLFEENPESAGVMGTVIEKAGGLVEQIPVIGEDVAKAFDMDSSAVRKTRTQARVTVSRLLSTVTGEESGRFTEQERRLAERVQATLEPTASLPQIRSALSQTMDILGRARTREVDRLRVGAEISAQELSSRDGIEKMGEILTQNGFTDEQAADAIVQLRERLGLIGEEIR